MKRVAQPALQWSAVLLVVLAGLEIGLRLFPATIPLALLARFGPGLRTAVAARLDLPNAAAMYDLPRSDGGPPLKLYKPFSRIAMRATDGERPPPVVVDRYGFCNPDDKVNDLAQVDVVAIGDSFTWCTAIAAADSWPAQLAATTGRSVLNLGVPGIGIHEYVEILRAFGLRRRPRVVVLNVYEGNDLRDAERYHEFVAKSARLSANARPPGGWLADRSYAWNLIVAALAAASEAIKDGRRPRNAIDFRYDLVFPEGAVPFNAANGDLDEAAVARRLAAGEIDLRLMDDGLVRYAALGRDGGFRAIVTYSPSAYTAYDGFVRFHDPALAAVMRSYSLRMRRHVAEICARLGLAFIDLTPALRAAGADERGAALFYGLGYRHPTRAGNAVVADTLARTLFAGPIAPGSLVEASPPT